MTMKLYSEESIQAIANAIREKNGSSDTYKVGEMATAITNIPSGGDDNYFYKTTIIPDAGSTGYLRVEFGSQATTIRYNTFSWNSTIGEIVIGDWTTTLSDDCLKQISYLSKIIIGRNVSRIGVQAFYDDKVLREIVINRETPPTLANKNAFDSLPSDYVVYVPSNSVNAYKSAVEWTYISSHIQAIQEN